MCINFDFVMYMSHKFYSFAIEKLMSIMHFLSGSDIALTTSWVILISLCCTVFMIVLQSFNV